jgi:hypothetical protein
MTQRSSVEQTIFDQVLKLVENLSPEAQEQLLEEMRLLWHQRAIEQAKEQRARDEELEARLAAKRRAAAERHRSDPNDMSGTW